MKLAKVNADSWEAFVGDSNMVLQCGTRPVLVVFKLYLVHRSPYSSQASETGPSRIHTCVTCFPPVCINLGKLHISPTNILIQADCLADSRWSHCKPSNKMYFYVGSLSSQEFSWWRMDPNSEVTYEIGKRGRFCLSYYNIQRMIHRPRSCPGLTFFIECFVRNTYPPSSKSATSFISCAWRSCKRRRFVQKNCSYWACFKKLMH